MTRAVVAGGPAAGVAPRSAGRDRGARAAILAVTLLLGLLLSACASDPRAGYATQSTFPDDIGTIAIPIVRNETLTRDIEFDLTDAVIKEVTSRTGYRLARQSQADSVLEIQIRNAGLTQLSKSPLTGLGEEVLVDMTIDFRWTDQRTDRVLVERKGFAASGLFVPSTPTGERIEIGQYAVIQSLARALVAEMRGDW